MNQEESEALRAELEYRQQPVELNPQILKNVFKETSLKLDWQVYIIDFWRKISYSLQQFLEWILIWKVETSFMMISVLMAIVIIPPLEPKLKSPPSIPQQIAVSNPQATAQTLQIELAKLGIIAKLKTVDDDWIVEVIDLSTDNLEALSALLKKYDLVLPSPGDESGLKIRILTNGR